MNAIIVPPPACWHPTSPVRADRDHVRRARTDRGQQAPGQRRHAGRERYRLLALVQLGERVLEPPDGGIPQSLIDVAPAG